MPLSYLFLFFFHWYGHNVYQNELNNFSLNGKILMLNIVHWRLIQAIPCGKILEQVFCQISNWVGHSWWPGLASCLPGLASGLAGWLALKPIWLSSNLSDWPFGWAGWLLGTSFHSGDVAFFSKITKEYHKVVNYLPKKVITKPAMLISTIVSKSLKVKGHDRIKIGLSD